MNRQFSFLTLALLAATLFCFVGCDLGTYNQRFNERDKPAPAKKAEKADSDSDSAESN